MTGFPWRGRAPAVERAARWCAGHPVTVAAGWLLLVAAAFTVGRHLGVTCATAHGPGGTFGVHQAARDAGAALARLLGAGAGG
jgi:hypothetical protein